MQRVLSALAAVAMVTATPVAAQQHGQVAATRVGELLEIVVPVCRRAMQLGPAYRGRQAQWMADQLRAMNLSNDDLLVGLYICNAYVRGSNDQMDGILPSPR
jgi:hypothetical protein